MFGRSQTKLLSKVVLTCTTLQEKIIFRCVGNALLRDRRHDDHSVSLWFHRTFPRSFSHTGVNQHCEKSHRLCTGSWGVKRHLMSGSTGHVCSASINDMKSSGLRCACVKNGYKVLKGAFTLTRRCNEASVVCVSVCFFFVNKQHWLASCFFCSLANNIYLLHPQARTESPTQSEVHLYDHIHTAGNRVPTETQQRGIAHTLQQSAQHCHLHCRALFW